jgi:hypothetical protein
MPVADFFERYQNGGYAAVIYVLATHHALPLTMQADEWFYLALLAYGEQDLPRAASLAANAAKAAPNMLLYTEAATYLARATRDGPTSVYLSPEAFSAFIRGGGNRALYAATSNYLQAVYTQTSAARILDIGVGDGLALLPALTKTIAQIDLIEPSLALLEQTSARLREHNVLHTAFQGTLQDFIAQADTHWDIIQATFSLQSIMLTERVPLLAWMRAHGQRILIAEFDVPHFTAMYSPDRTAYVSTRFEQGLAEYHTDGGLVAQGFLMPILFGYFDRTAARTNYEHPISEWIDQLRMAGFTSVRATPLYPYWWATAYVIDAS